MSWKWEFTKKSAKQITKLPPPVASQIIDKIDSYIKTNNPLLFAKSLRDHTKGQYRFRIGDYRVIFDVEDDTIVILDLGHRRDIYR